jgi:putative transposase
MTVTLSSSGRPCSVQPRGFLNWPEINSRAVKPYAGEARVETPRWRRLKQLEDENAKLRKVVADLSRDKEMLQDVIRRKL